MPTGYTADVESGKVTDFRQFALKCARAFGACVEMRDDDIDKLPPEDGFSPSAWHVKELAKVKADKAKLLKLSEAAKVAGAEKQYLDHLESWQQRQDKDQVLCSRYEAMINKVKAWMPPSKDHNDFKTFMLEQLETSMEHDILGDYVKKPKRISPDQWFRSELESADHSIEYHTRENEKEIERASGRSRWVKDLYASLKG